LSKPGAKAYIGDSVYVEVVYGSLKLTTENGEGPPSNTIVLEDDVYQNLVAYRNKAVEEFEALRRGPSDTGAQPEV
jgi:hypothetical protein